MHHDMLEGKSREKNGWSERHVLVVVVHVVLDGVRHQHQHLRDSLPKRVLPLS